MERDTSKLPTKDGDWRRARDGSLYDANQDTPPDSDSKEVTHEETNKKGLFDSLKDNPVNPDEEV